MQFERRIGRRTATGEQRAFLALAVAALLTATVATASAQLAKRSEPKLAVPATLLVAPGSETVLTIDISGIESLPKNAFLRLRGLPGSAALSEGHAVAPGVWAVPLASLPGLKLRVPTNLAGKASVTLSLVSIDGQVIAETQTALVIAAMVAALSAPQPQAQPQPQPEVKSKAPRAEPQIAPAPPAPAPPAKEAGVLPPAAQVPSRNADDIKRADAFLARGRRSLGEGSIAEARLHLERAAELGHGEAALLLGATYDPAELKRLGAIGVVPDPQRARRWYELAQKLGSAAAAVRLQRIGR